MPIHPTAIVDKGAKIHDKADIGPFVVIGPNVEIAAGTKIGPNAVLDGHTTIGENCNIYAGVTIGLEPQDLSYKGEPTGCKIGNNVTIREYATIHRATKEGFTTVGDDSFLMAYVHIAHNCQVGKGVIMANAASLAGYVEVGDYTVMSGFVIIHQNVRIGRMCMLSGMTGSRSDLPPFTNLDGRPAMVRGINALGLKRNKLSLETRTAIKEAYRIIYRTGLNTSNALARVSQEIEQFDEVKEIVEFFKNSKRGCASAFIEDTGIESSTKQNREYSQMT